MAPLLMACFCPRDPIPEAFFILGWGQVAPLPRMVLAPGTPSLGANLVNLGRVACGLPPKANYGPQDHIPGDLFSIYGEGATQTPSPTHSRPWGPHPLGPL